MKPLRLLEMTMAGVVLTGATPLVPEIRNPPDRGAAVFVFEVPNR